MDEQTLPETRVFTLAQELAEVGRLVEADDVPETVSRYVRRAVALLPGCDYAAIIAVGEKPEALEIVAAYGVPDLPDPAGDEFFGNPVEEAIRYREPRRLDDTRTDERWPAYSDYLRRNGYASALALPLPAVDSAAAFVVASTEPGRFGDNSHDLALLFTLHAGVAFDNATLYHDNQRLLDHVQAALRTRTVIGQAQGLLMRHNRWTGPEAFARLADASQRRNTKVRDLAASVVAAHHAGNLTATLAQYGLAPAGGTPR